MDYFDWHINPILLDIGFLKIRWYGLMFASAFMFSYAVMQWAYQREGKKIEDLDTLLWYVAIGTIVGARLGHTLLYDPAYYLSNPLKILAIWEGGLASHGGIAGIVLALYFYKRRTGDSWLWLLDRVALPSVMGGCFIRIGNFFNSEILGIESHEPWAIIFSRIDNVPRHPVQLYEAFSYALIFLFVLAVYYKTYNKPIRGLLFGLVITLVFIVRIILEFFKTEQAMYENHLPLTTGQLLSIPFLLMGLSCIIYALKNYRATTNR